MGDYNPTILGSCYWGRSAEVKPEVVHDPSRRLMPNGATGVEVFRQKSLMLCVFMFLYVFICFFIYNNSVPLRFFHFATSSNLYSSHALPLRTYFEGQVATSVFLVQDQIISLELISWRCQEQLRTFRCLSALARHGQILCGIATRRNRCRRGWSPDARFRVLETWAP